MLRWSNGLVHIGEQQLRVAFALVQKGLEGENIIVFLAKHDLAAAA